MNDIDFDAMCAEPTGQPEPVATSLEGDDDAGDPVTGLDGVVAPAMQQMQQRVLVGRELLQRIAANAGTIAATSQLDWLISMTTINVLS